MSAGVDCPRSKITETIGAASTIRPTVAGTLSISIIRRLLEMVARMPRASAWAAKLEIAGTAAVAIDTPKRPIGRYISRNA